LESVLSDGIKLWSDVGGGLGFALQIILWKSQCENCLHKPTKNPSKRPFELNKKLYLVNITVEGFESLTKGSSGEEGGDDNGGDDGDFDDCDDLEDNQDMDTDKHSEKSTPHPSPHTSPNK
jgi:hypothetical protein